ncbi:MAG TPA: MerR family transcriptional regulator [Alphaproteobacteria bacterium]|nr:MerR family transcriptional regulator [Alphaproteobacteria bacterium]
MNNKFIDYNKEPMLFPELEKSIMEEEQVVLEENFKTISEVAKDLELATSVIRYWETKFPVMSPVKRNNRRYYSNKDQKTIANIKNLLYIQGYTIKAVQDILANGTVDDLGKINKPDGNTKFIKSVITKLEKIRDCL